MELKKLFLIGLVGVLCPLYSDATYVGLQGEREPQKPETPVQSRYPLLGPNPPSLAQPQTPPIDPQPLTSAQLWARFRDGPQPLGQPGLSLPGQDTRPFHATGARPGP